MTIDPIDRTSEPRWIIYKSTFQEIDMNQIICDAIRMKSVIEFFYDGGIRIVEPHCHGISRAGNEVLRGYQTGGYSESGNPIGWKLFNVSGISNLQLSDSVFSEARPGYNPSDKHMNSIHCNI